MYLKVRSPTCKQTDSFQFWLDDNFTSFILFKTFQYILLLFSLQNFSNVKDTYISRLVQLFLNFTILILTLFFLKHFEKWNSNQTAVCCFCFPDQRTLSFALFLFWSVTFWLRLITRYINFGDFWAKSVTIF